MKLLDKFKDLFMDDVIEDDEIDVMENEEEKVYQEPKKNVLPKVMRESIHEEERVQLPKENVIKKENEVGSVQGVKKFNFEFDMDEFPSRENRKVDVVKVDQLKPLKMDKTVSNQVKEVPKKDSNLYPRKEENWVKPKFKASPVISPVYGVLDKNYKKEEVKERTEDRVEIKRPSKKVDFETVRKKAFGNLSDEIKDSMCENCELYKEAKKNMMLQEDDLLYDMTVEDNKEVTIEKAYDNYEEFGVLYEPKTKVERQEKKEEIKEIEKTLEEVPTRESVKEEKKEEVKVDADFFELIDSMYKERVDD